MRTILATTLAASLLAMCGGEDDDTPPPPPPTAAGPSQLGAQVGQATGGSTATPGQVMVTVVANSTPPGAQVMGGGRLLGTTPLSTQVPVPAPQPGQAQSFTFTFSLAGYQTATLQAAPVNNAISITAALAPSAPPEVPVVAGSDDGDDGDDGDDDGALSVRGHGGGPIRDNQHTRGTATVAQACVIDQLRVRLRGNHSYYGDLHISVRDPQGRNYSLANGGTANPFRTHVVRRARGRQARGRWSLDIHDRLNADSGMLNGWNLLIRCQ